MSSNSDVVMGRRAFLRGSTLMLAAGIVEGTGALELMAIEPGKPALKIGLLTDVHYADKDPAMNRFYRESISKVREAVGTFNRMKTDFVVELGDLIDSAESVEKETANLKSIQSELAAFQGDCFYVLGNHCVSALSKKDFLDTTRSKQSQTYYSFDHGQFHFVVLDACFREDGVEYDRGNFKWTDSDVPEHEREWLRKDLQETKKPTVLFMHQRLDVEDAHAAKSAPKVREILEKSGRVLAVFQGHSHKNDYKELGGIHYCTIRAMVEGSGEENSGYAVLSLFPNGSIHLAGFRQQPERQFKKP